MFYNNKKSDLLQAIELRKKSREQLNSYREQLKTLRLQENGRAKLWKMLECAERSAIESYKFAKKDPQISEQLAYVYYQMGDFLLHEQPNYKPSLDNLRDVLKYLIKAEELITKTHALFESIQDRKNNCFCDISIKCRVESNIAAKNDNPVQERSLLDEAYLAIQQIDCGWLNKQLPSRKGLPSREAFFYDNASSVLKYLSDFYRENPHQRLEHLKTSTEYAKKASKMSLECRIVYASSADVLAYFLVKSTMTKKKGSAERTTLLKEACELIKEANQCLNDIGDSIKRDQSYNRIKIHFHGYNGHLQLDLKQNLIAAEYFKNAYEFENEVANKETNLEQKTKYQAEANGYKHLRGVALTRHMTSLHADQRTERAEIARTAVDLFESLNEFRKAGLVWCILADKIRSYDASYHQDAIDYYRDGIALIKKDYALLYTEDFKNDKFEQTIRQAEEAETQGKYSQSLDLFRQARLDLINWGQKTKKTLNHLTQHDAPKVPVDDAHKNIPKPTSQPTTNQWSSGSSLAKKLNNNNASSKPPTTFFKIPSTMDPGAKPFIPSTFKRL